MGQRVTLPDVVLDNLPEPVCLLCEETLSPNEEVEQEPYSVSSCCGSCGTIVKIACIADPHGIKALEQLLYSHLKILCVRCVKNKAY